MDAQTEDVDAQTVAVDAQIQDVDSYQHRRISYTSKSDKSDTRLTHLIYHSNA